MHENIAELKRKVPLEQVLAHFNHDVPTNRLIGCLWHNDSTPSLRVFPDGGFCFACDKLYDIFDFIKQLAGLEFKDGVAYVEKTFLNNPNYGKFNTDREKWQKKPSSTSQFSYSNYLNAIGWITYALNQFTQSCVTQGIPEKFCHFFEHRKFDSKFLIETNYFKDNIIFLHERRQIAQDLNRVVGRYEMQTSGLMRLTDKGFWSLCSLNDTSYCFLFPIWSFDAEHKLMPVAIRIRNIDPTSSYPKEIDFIVKGINRPSLPGFIGLKRAFNQYPEATIDSCDGLTVFLCEGTTDFIAAHELIHQFNILGGSNEKTIILTAGGVHNNSIVENLQLVKNCARLIVGFDNDYAGKKGFFKARDAAQSVGIKRVEQYQLDSNFKDLNQYLFNIKKGISNEQD